jgi:hypothetical protein
MLIPCCWWCGCVPPFTDSTPDQAVGHRFGGGLWVWLGGTLPPLVRSSSACCGGWGLARCWVLRGHPCGLVGVFLGAAPGLVGLTHGLCCVVAAVVLGCGCVLSVA